MNESPADVNRRAYFEVSLALPWLLHLPDLEFVCKIGPNDCRLLTKAHIAEAGQPHGDKPQMAVGLNTGAIMIGKGVHLPGAMLKYTEVFIRFSKILKTESVTQEDSREVTTVARDFLNYFLDVYRFTVKDSEVRPLTVIEFHEFRGGRGLLLKSNVRHDDRHGEATFELVLNREDPFVFGQVPLLTEQQTKELRQHLESGDVPRLSPLLLLNARMQIRAGQRRFAVIEMNSALDIVVEEKAKLWLINNGCSEIQAESRLEWKNTKAIMKEILLPTLKVPDDWEFPWAEWCTECGPLRNRVVHDAYEPSREEAERSYEIISKLCLFLNGLELEVKSDEGTSVTGRGDR